MHRTATASPRVLARTAGVFYLLVFVTGGTALSLAGGVVVAGDAAATAANILAKESVFRFGFSANLIATACYVVVTGLFYELFKPVNKTISLVAAFFSLVGCAIGAASSLFHLAPLNVLGGAAYLNAFNAQQLQALSLVFLKLDAQTSNIGLVFFGFYCALIGWLIFRSAFLPRILGVLMGLAGLGWLTFLWPPLAASLSPYVLAPGIFGEGALTLWLLAFGVNPQHWNERGLIA
jgi:hypothetical protein